MRNCLSLCFLVMTQCLFAQETPVFQPFTGKLSQNTVACIQQDSYGFMWFGTGYGLNKYDGRVTNVLQHDPQDSLTLSSNFIRDISQDLEGNLWVACDAAGLSLLDYQSGVVKRIRHSPDNPSSLSSDFVSCLTTTQSGDVWVGTEDAGICKYVAAEKRFVRYRHNRDDVFSLSGNHVSDVIEDRNGLIWVATWGHGLNLFDPNTRRFIHYGKTDEGLRTNVIRCLNEGKNDIWVGTSSGVRRLTYNDGRYTLNALFDFTNETIKLLNQLTVLAILEDEHGQLWIGTENGGLFVADLKNETIAIFKHDGLEETSLIGNSVWSLFEDKTGNIWVGTFNKGICVADKHHRRFKHVRNHLESDKRVSDNIVSSFAEDQNGNVWIGTDGDGLSYLNESTGEYTHFSHAPKVKNSLLSNAVLSLEVDKDNDLWVATWKGGVCLKRDGAAAFEKIKFDRAASTPGDALYLMQDNRGAVWTCMFREGIYIYDKTQGRSYGLKTNARDSLSISSNKNRALLQDSDGAFWIATEGSGLDRIEVDENYRILSKVNYSENIKDSFAISQNLVTCLYQDHKNRIWVGTFNGLNLYERGTNSFKKLYESDGLASNMIYSIQEDLLNNLWVSTNNGLSRINTETMEIHNYGVLDGLQNKEFYKNASLRKQNGELLFGGINGFNRFFPGSIRRNENIPDVYITGLVVSNHESYHLRNTVVGDVIPDQSLSLAYDENDLEFQVAVLNYSQPAKNGYAYKLQHYDDDWIHVSDPSRITYTNVPPGRYVFKVKGSNNDGVWNETGAQLKVHIRQPWWLSGWAYGAYMIIGALLLLGARAMIINQERIKNEYKLEHMELTKMQEMDDMKSRFFANISHEFRTPLTLILSPLKSLSNNTYQGDPVNQFKIMQRNASRLLRLVNQLLDLSKLESGSMRLQATKNDLVAFIKPIAHSFTSYAEKQVLDYRCSFPSEPIEIYFEREKLEKVVINIISNAFKYTPEYGKIKLSVAKEEGGVSIAVEDTGVGISEKDQKYIFNRFYQVNNKDQKGTGIGLALTQELVELHKGSIQVFSKIGEGAKFVVFLQEGRDHLDEDQVLENTVENELKRNLVEEGDAEFEMEDLLIKKPVAQEEEVDDLPLILVAEDNEDLRFFITDHLITGYKVIEAVDGQEAWNAAIDRIPDLIVSDVMMPKIDGYELCQKVKSDERTSHIPFILLTAKASQDSLEKGLEQGADYYITKPFNPKLLELRIKNILNTRDQIRSRNFDQKTVSLEPKQMQLTSKDEEFLKKVMNCIENNMSNSDFGVDDLCKELGLSRAQLFRKLKALVGQSANKFIRSIRLKRAASLLKQSELNISEITYQVGFNDLHYFRYSFKKQFGVNPSEYAKINVS